MKVPNKKHTFWFCAKYKKYKRGLSLDDARTQEMENPQDLSKKLSWQGHLGREENVNMLFFVLGRLRVG